MESESGTCPSCGSSEISMENYEYVCCNCGDIIGQSDAEFNNLPDADAYVENLRNKDYEASSRLTGRIRNETNSSNRISKIYRRKILDDARKTVKQVVKDENSIDEIIEMIDKALDNSKRTSSAKKSALIGSSIYLISKKNNLGFSIGDICKSLCIKLKAFNESMRHIKGTDPLTQSVDLKSTIFDGCIKSVLRNSAFNMMDAHDKHLMEDKIKLLLMISDRMIVGSQRSPQCIVPAATYLAWKSINMFEKLCINNTEMKLTKSDVSFSKFCQMLDLKRTNAMSKSATELTSLITKLALPFCDIEKRKDLDYSLKCIIENSSTLLEEYSANKSNTETMSRTGDIIVDA